MACFERIILIARRYDVATASTLGDLHKALKKKGFPVFFEKKTAVLFKFKNVLPVKEDAIKNTGDLLMVVGGDGSLLSVARLAAARHLPLVGINRGRLGFLTDIAPHEITSVLNILKGHYREEKRRLLKACVFRRKTVCFEAIAVNDIVLLAGNLSKLIEFSIEINQTFMCTQRADGLIVATPTGSTAYALSGGGPVLHPALDAVVLVPMFPHKLTSRPVVVSGSCHIKITFLSARNAGKNPAYPRVSCDGQSGFALNKGDEIHIMPFEKPLRLIHPVTYDYFSVLRSKLHWENTL